MRSSSLVWCIHSKIWCGSFQDRKSCYRLELLGRPTPKSRSAHFITMPIYTEYWQSPCWYCALEIIGMIRSYVIGQETINCITTRQWHNWSLWCSRMFEPRIWSLRYIRFMWIYLLNMVRGRNNQLGHIMLIDNSGQKSDIAWVVFSYYHPASED